MKKERVSLKKEGGVTTLIIQGLPCFNRKRYFDYTFLPTILGVLISLFSFPFIYDAIQTETSNWVTDLTISFSPLLLILVYGIIRNMIDKRGLGKTMTLTIDKSKAIFEHKKLKKVSALSSVYVYAGIRGPSFLIKFANKKIYGTVLSTRQEYDMLKGLENRLYDGRI